MKYIIFPSALVMTLLAGCSTQDDARVERISYPYPVYTGSGSVSGEGAFETGTATSSSQSTYGPSTEVVSVPSATKEANAAQTTTISQVRQHLQNDAELAILLPDLRFRQEGGAVVVSGTVPYAQKQQIETLLQRNANLNVRSELAVSSQSSQDSSSTTSAATGGTEDATSADVEVRSSTSSSAAGADTDSSATIDSDASAQSEIDTDSEDRMPGEGAEQLESSASGSVSVTNSSAEIELESSAAETDSSSVGGAESASDTTRGVGQGVSSSSTTNVQNAQPFFGSRTNINLTPTNQIVLETTNNSTGLTPTGNQENRSYPQTTNNLTDRNYPGSKPIDSDKVDRR